MDQQCFVTTLVNIIIIRIWIYIYMDLKILTIFKIFFSSVSLFNLYLGVKRMSGNKKRERDMS